MRLFARTFLLVASLLSAASASAQEHAPPAAVGQAPNAAAPEEVDIITPHITDGYHMEIPYFLPPFYKEICLGRHVGEHGCEALWEPIHLGAWEVNLSPTKHVVMLVLAAIIVSILLIGAARAHVRQTKHAGRHKGFAAAMESVVLYIRNEVILPNVGPHGERVRVLWEFEDAP